MCFHPCGPARAPCGRGGERAYLLRRNHDVHFFRFAFESCAFGYTTSPIRGGGACMCMCGISIKLWWVDGGGLPPCLPYLVSNPPIDPLRSSTSAAMERERKGVRSFLIGLHVCSGVFVCGAERRWFEHMLRFMRFVYADKGLASEIQGITD